MNWLTLIQLLISLTQGVISGMTTAGAPKEMISAMVRALKEFQTVHGTLVTKAQVDAHTLQYKW